ncbi:hypothetical protein [Microbispora sp. KK1-11]|uniref:hypothetical protein n=1 Tax=Microbispora sp. KK1-11 TaxID=2053005 RepID=UPI001156E61B|nr:hypothetical protein [Microbispora sp. KK1-11]TQS29142.1 hypothetical protein FLW16_12415 [Microbispora sp. KK1-11]
MMTNLTAEALAYLDQARAALTDHTLDPHAAALDAYRCTRIASLALAEHLGHTDSDGRSEVGEDGAAGTDAGSLPHPPSGGSHGRRPD